MTTAHLCKKRTEAENAMFLNIHHPKNRLGFFLSFGLYIHDICLPLFNSSLRPQRILWRTGGLYLQSVFPACKLQEICKIVKSPSPTVVVFPVCAAWQASVLFSLFVSCLPPRLILLPKSHQYYIPTSFLYQIKSSRGFLFQHDLDLPLKAHFTCLPHHVTQA